VSLLYTGSALDDPTSVRTFVYDAPGRAEFRRVMMVDPAHFQVRHVINPHMEGMIGSVDTENARDEWEAIRATRRRPDVSPSGNPAGPDRQDCPTTQRPFVLAASVWEHQSCRGGPTGLSDPH